MNRNITMLSLFTVLVTVVFTTAGATRSHAEPTKLAHAIYLTTSQACGCILDRCQASDWVVEKTFVGEKKALLKRLDYAIDRESAKEYIKKYRIPIPPALLFLDQNGNLLWRVDGELDLDLVMKKLKEFGA